MCGLVGVLGARTGGFSEATESVLQKMTRSLAHRGPDDAGTWLDLDGGIALGHRRLSVLDLSELGHQPMQSKSGRYVVVFNGEIYNHLELRKVLSTERDMAWRGHSDTETLLAGFEAWGISATLCRSVGMFALAVWDRRERQLYLARDRMGEKPLYFGWCNGVFLFGSELKALRAWPGFSNEISRGALTLYVRHSYVPAPFSIYQDVYKLEPGCLMRLGTAAVGQAPATAPCAGERGQGWSIERYWSLSEQVESGLAEPLADESEALDLLEQTLGGAVTAQQLSDVPLGAFLSGGVDSSLVVALMQARASRPVKTFTIGFDEDVYSEAEHALAVARHLGTDHTELRVSAQDALAVVPQLAEIYDEPFADSSQVPTFLVAKLARQGVTVALSGDGGDELFGGYNRYLYAPAAWNKARWLPALLRQPAGDMLSRLSRLVDPERPLKTSYPSFVAQPGEKLRKLGRRLRHAGDPDEFYLSLVSEWLTPAEVVVGGHEPATLLNRQEAWPRLVAFEDRMMYLDAMTYLPDDILCKVDRAAMANSLETRVPMLDHRVVELAWRLPMNMKIRAGQGKWILRQLLDRFVPRGMIERPKQGFAVPLADWLRGSLSEWAADLLEPGRLHQQGYLQAGVVREKWAQHLSGKQDWSHSLWSVLMFQAWLRNQGES